ncbi:MAG: DivIVA domain-containing protein [Candidatus Rokubacteria bacterium]|nr:DivIVA domain-containing protein [Candidatus Rokubacteria bacterium]
MRLSPSDVRQQHFTERMFRGFDKDEVDRFLDQIAEDYESVIKENALLKEQLAAFEERSRSTADLERTLQDTLVTTQRVTDEMKTNAKREVELMVREAKLTGEKILEEARAEEARIVSEVKTLKRTRRQLLEDLRATLGQYQRIFSGELGGFGDEDESRS